MKSIDKLFNKYDVGLVVLLPKTIRIRKEIEK
jgi:hypothetical protein